MSGATSPVSGNPYGVPTNYPGFIARQHLIDFCQQKMLEINENRREFGDLIDIEDMEISDKETIDCADAREMGKQMALREVCEWAKEHQVPGDKGASEYTTRGG